MKRMLKVSHKDVLVVDFTKTKSRITKVKKNNGPADKGGRD